MEFKFNYDEDNICSFSFEINGIEGDLSDFGALKKTEDKSLDEDEYGCVFSFIGRHDVSGDNFDAYRKVCDKYDLGVGSEYGVVVATLESLLHNARCYGCT